MRRVEVDAAKVALEGWQLSLLVLAAFVAGLVDAIAGGGGLLTLPSLLAVRLPPHLALGTNKGQSVFGALAATWRYARSGLVDGKEAAWTFPSGLVGSLLGAALLLSLDPTVLRPVVLALFVFAGAVVAFRRSAPVQKRPTPVHARAVAVAIAFAIGAYDGFFGPGTGTFLFLAFFTVLGETAPRATASAKVVNLASNLAAVALFAARGGVLWQVALPMAAAQIAGGWLGAHLAVKAGERLIRRAVLLVVLALVVKLARDLFGT